VPPEKGDPDGRATAPARFDALTARGQRILLRLSDERPRHASVEVVFRWLLCDREIAGGVLGGGLAYRLFFWLLALTLFFCGGLGLADNAHTNLDTALTDSGLSASVVDVVNSAAAQSNAGRWWLIVIGAWSYLWFSWGLLRALRLVHAAAWRTPVPAMRNAPRSLGVVLLAPFAILLLTAAAGFARSQSSRAPGVLATLVVGAGFGLVWLFISRRLPAKRDLPIAAFLPGAIVFGIGLEALHVFTVYFLAAKLASSSTLYGTLGLAVTSLFYLFLIGRGIVWAAELNSVVWTVRNERRGL
jgi:hypothetical protein